MVRRGIFQEITIFRNGSCKSHTEAAVPGETFYEKSTAAEIFTLCYAFNGIVTK
jgi:hypothetical protein